MNKISSNILFILGGLAVIIGFLPYVILGQDAIFVYHDQLDGELIAYLLHARHLGESGPFLEFMGGSARTALTVPAPLFVLLYSVMDAHLALALMQLLGSLCGFAGMYLLVKMLCKTVEPLHFPIWVEELVAVAIGLIYAYLPFLPVYGLSQYGMPLLLVCGIWICRKEKGMWPWLYVLLYGLCSSLVLSGFGVLAVGVVAALILFIGKKKTAAGRLFAFVGVLLGVYVAENLELLGQILLGHGETSHKGRYVLYGSAFWPTLWENLVDSKVHTNDFHSTFLWGVVLVAACLLLTRKYKKLTRTMGVFLGCIAGASVISAFWDCTLGVMLREEMGGLRSFQMNRLLWLTPFLWYALLALALFGVANHLWESRQKEGIGCKACAWIGVLMLVGMVVLTGGKVLTGSHLKANVKKMVNAQYNAMSFSDYYAIGVMEQVEKYIEDITGAGKEDYRVVSFGIDPAAALYHGFYCLDGYSNNYDLAYKLAFRQVIASELERSEYIRQSFDDWGNRCYLFSSECPGYYTIEKGGFYLKDFQIDTEALKILGGDDTYSDGAGIYLFSAVYIENAESRGLTLMRELPFETEDSYYRIFLYEVEK